MMVSFNHVSPAGVSFITWYHVFGHLIWKDEASELFADHQEEAELAYDQYAGVIAGAIVFVKAHHFEASGKGHAGSLLPEGSGTGIQPSYSLSA
jgi:hypothetical protein